MKKSLPIFSVFIFLAGFFFFNPAPNLRSQDLDQTVQSLKSFDYDKATDLGKIKGYAKNEASKFLHQTEVKQKMEGWVKGAKEKWVAKYGAYFDPRVPLEKHAPDSIMAAMKMGGMVWEKSSDYREFLKGELTNQMQVQFPSMTPAVVTPPSWTSRSSPWGLASTILEP